MFVDDRSSKQRKTHKLAWVGTDRVLSGWGEARNGASYAGWAFEDGYSNRVESWVRSRTDMSRVRLVVLDDYKPTAAHTHIYVVSADHPAAQ